MTCITVDDEPLALDLLGGYIKKVPFLDLKGSFDSAFEALNILQNENIDLIFLDINMPDLTGIEFLKSLSKPPSIIFTTAYQQYAVEGFELDVVDYLLKPFSFDRFLKAVNKVNRMSKPKEDLNTQTKQQDNFILIKVEHNIIKVPLNNIYYIEAYKDYVKIHTRETLPLLTLKSMKAMEEMLTDKGFIRIHRSYIISIEKIELMRNNKILIKQKYLPIGDNYKETVHERIVKGRI